MIIFSVFGHLNSQISSVVFVCVDGGDFVFKSNE